MEMEMAEGEFPGSYRERKSKRNGKKMMYNSNGEWGKWEDLNPEILALILVRIPAEERVATASLVCKSWMSCVLGPFCWSDIDIQDWCRRRHLAVEYVNSAVRKLVRRSKGTFRRLSAFRLGDSGFAFAANCGRCLKVLEIPMSEVNDKIVAKFAESLVNLSVMDISYCLKITHVGIEAFGKNCKSLTQLKRNMPPQELERLSSTSKVNELEAMVIADTMPLLQHLQLGFGCFGDTGLGAILAKCKALTHLDIQGCWNVKLEGELEDRCLQLPAFKSPWVYDLFTDNDEQDDENKDDEYSSSDSE
ncbi:hypothetical protein ES288_A12G278300v1 [Gossypium darwinii]|uniref:F-box domain-containing protein n=1 Tax=Gossypium darwinii TaxID=34276 RepID=A0A5D2EEM3_GOSDA|nr:hypothetical protein ES288_A12G278300v1 [Gossypium darwinii]